MTTDAAPQALLPIYAASAAAGLIVVPMPEGQIDTVDGRQAFGRRVVALATALEAARPLALPLQVPAKESDDA